MPRKKTIKKAVRNSNKKEIKEHNKVLKIVFIGAVIVLLLVFVGYMVVYSMNHFAYQGVKFEIAKFCDTKPCLIVYKTSLPVTVNGQKAIYNFYLRKDPRIISNIQFDGELNLLPTMVINSTNSLNCGGDGVIAIANLVKLYEVLGVKSIKNDSLACNPSKNYMFLNIREGNATSIEQTGTTCYNINVNNCQILEGTEKLMLETFVKIDKIIANSTK